MPFKNKEDKKAWQKKYNQANKDKIATWHIDNKDRVAAYKKSWSKNNKDKIKISRDKEKDGFHTVYYLRKELYVGVTNSLKRRLGEHKYVANRYVEDAEIIGKYKTRKEALTVEAEYHAKGYLGANKHHNKTTTKQQ